MTPKTKLEIIGPYTQEHSGPFCTREGHPVRVITHIDGSAAFPIVGLVADERTPTAWDNTGSFFGEGQRDRLDLMNARECPMAREFRVNEYGLGCLQLATSAEEAALRKTGCNDFLRTIHAREIMPGESA